MRIEDRAQHRGIGRVQGLANHQIDILLTFRQQLPDVVHNLQTSGWSEPIGLAGGQHR